MMEHLYAIFVCTVLIMMFLILLVVPALITQIAPNHHKMKINGVECITYEQGLSTSISCDWNGK